MLNINPCAENKTTGGEKKKSLWSHGAYNLMKDTNDKQ